MFSKGRNRRAVEKLRRATGFISGGVRRFLASRKLALCLESRWFQWGVGIFYFSVVGYLFLTAELWPATPATGGEPAIQISVWDAAQAWRLRALAKRHEAAGRFEEAVQAWRLALAEHPGPASFRASLKSLVAMAPDKQHQKTAGRHGLQLLRLSHMNSADLELATQTFNHYELGRLTLEILERHPGERSDALERDYLKALFLQGRVENFAQQWERIQDKLLENAETQLFRAAYCAGWGAPAAAAEGLNRLEAARKKTETAILAHQLQLFVSYVKLDASAYRESLDFLTCKKADRPSCHINYWNLLAETGQEHQAVRLATRHPLFSDPPPPAAAMAEAFVKMGRPDIAFQFLRRPPTGLDFGFFEDWRRHRADFLMAKRQWNELGAWALSIRRDRRTQAALQGYSFFLEGFSAFQRGHPAAAAEAFQKISAYPLEEERRGLFVASHLIRLKFYPAARDVLLKLRRRHKDKLVFWHLLYVAAKEIGAPQELLSAAANLHRLQPQNLEARNRYAAVLLSLKLRPEATMALTAAGMQQNPHDPAGKIHHARALLLNERVDEAADLLESINGKLLIEALEQGFYFARLEAAFQKGQFEVARQAVAKIRPKLLLPGDRWRFREIGDLLASLVGESGGHSSSAKGLSGALSF